MVHLSTYLPRSLTLQSYVKSYTYGKGQFNSVTRTYLTRLFPNSNSNISFVFGDANNSLLMQNKIKVLKKGTYVNVAYYDWVDLYRDTDTRGKVNGEIFTISFLPGMFYQIFKISASELFGFTDIILSDIIGKSNEQLLYEMLEESFSVDKKIEIIEAFLLSYINKTKNTQQNYVLKEAKKKNFLINLEEYSKEIGYSKRWIQEKFKHEMGYSFKQLQKISQVKKSLMLIQFYISTQREFKLIEITYEVGFYDQSHFIKSFKEITGFTPKELITIIKKQVSTHKSKLFKTYNHFQKL